MNERIEIELLDGQVITIHMSDYGAGSVYEALKRYPVKVVRVVETVRTEAVTQCVIGDRRKPQAMRKSKDRRA